MKAFLDFPALGMPKHKFMKARDAFQNMCICYLNHVSSKVLTNEKMIPYVTNSQPASELLVNYINTINCVLSKI